jgi:predicted DNA-binding protein
MTQRSRLNARLGPEMQRKVAYLRRRTGMDTSEVVRASIEHYYEVVRGAGANARDVLEASGFVASGSGPSDLSARYKEHLTASLHRKHT